MFQTPYYKIENEDLKDGAKICIVTDSIGYRTISLLSMVCSEITILDPRFFEGEDLTRKALEDQVFDAVIVYQTFLLDNGNLGID